jgi:hypothetical protein
LKSKKANKIFIPDKLEDHVDPLRSMIAASHSQRYRAFRSLPEAAANGGVVILQGDDGGQIYLTCPATKIKCSEADLRSLLEYLDSKAWKDASSASVRFEMCPSLKVAGGMGGGLVTDDVWLHPELRPKGLEESVRSFIYGQLKQL